MKRMALRVTALGLAAVALAVLTRERPVAPPPVRSAAPAYVRSPIAGTVIERYLDAGEGVTPEIPILDVADLERVWINVEVDETDIGKLRVGDVVAVTSDAFPGRTFKGRVRQIADYAGLRRIRPAKPAVNPGLKIVQVKVELLERTPLRLGMTVDATITPSAAH